MNGIDVVVCVAARRAPLEDCMHALRREAGDAVRVVSERYAWQARQRAAEESIADVLAFVDPDVVVPEGWLDALRMAWETSPRSVGAIGGPIRADVSEWAGGRLGLIDLGPDLLELDPAERTLMGGNLSFWRRALVGVGGFGVPADGRDATDWHSEEHEAQRQLGHWGWLVRYAPGLGAERVVEKPRPLSRSWRYGVRSGIAGSRPTGSAFRQGVRSGAGAMAALARGNHDGALERAARAAENFGVLAGRRRMAVPSRSAAIESASGTTSGGTAGGTPPPAARGPVRSPAAAGPGVDLVLLYHRFASAEPDPLGLCVSPDNFEAQLHVLRDDHAVVPLADIAATVRAGEAGSGRIAITIDDGYLDNLTHGVPLIAEAGLPATLFAATGHIESGRRFFWDEMQRLLTGPGVRPDRLELLGSAWPTATPDQRETVRAVLHRLIQPRSADEIVDILARLRDWAGAAAGEPAEATRPVTVDELRQLAQTPGLEIGAHTRDHVNLAHQGPDELRSQVERSRDDVTEWIGTPPVAFSYPFGIPRQDVSEQAKRAVAASAFGCAVVNQPIAVEAGDDVYAIPRMFTPDVGADEFRSWLERALR